uniref:Transmembrane protein n=1 Tax=Panagrellus redivivus TaxID=6233 RepID=A0A7E4UWJ2_PANRE
MSSLIDRFNNANNGGELDLTKFGIFVKREVETVFDLGAAKKTCPNDCLEDCHRGKSNTLVDDADELCEDEVKSVYAFEGMASEPDNSMKESYLSKFGIDNDGVESVYAFEALNETRFHDDVLNINDDVSVDETDNIEHRNGMSVLHQLRTDLKIVDMIVVLATVVFLIGALSLYQAESDFVFVACDVACIFLLGLVYNNLISRRLQDCEKWFNLASTKANVQTAKAVRGNSADEHVTK